MRFGRLAEGALTAGVVIALIAAGLLYKGVPARQVVFNDGGVWVINSQLRLVGHLNAQSRTLDGGLRAASNAFDILQAAGSVLLDDLQGNSLQRIEPNTVSIAGQIELAGLTVSHGAGRLAIADPNAGKVWALEADQLSGFSTAQDALLDKVPGAEVVITSAGTGYAVSPSGELQYLTQLDGRWQASSAGQLDSGLSTTDVELTAVGETVVALDRATGKLVTPEATYSLDPPRGGTLENVRLQPPGPSSDAVLLATQDALISYPLAGGDPHSFPAGASGTAARPVFHEGCGYAVWGGSGAYIRDCPQDADDVHKTYQDLGRTKDLSFRTNRKVIVVNDNITGDTYLPEQGMTIVNNWDVVKSQVEEQDKKQDDQSTGAQNELTDPEFTDQQAPPTANPDTFGARAGAATTLPVLVNDVDPDGDVLTAVVEKAPVGVSVLPTRGGRGLRIDLPADASEPITFSYRASDGQATSAPAKVTVRVRPATMNSPPEQMRTPRLKIAERSSVTYAMLSDWVDPDGDQLFLQDASDPPGLKVTFRQDGTVTVQDLGTGGPGLREVDVVVADGALSGRGTLRVEVSPRGVNIPPIANADHFWGVVKKSVRVTPLSNDTDPNHDRLSLTELMPAARGTSITPDYIDGSFQFTADAPGTYIVGYAVSDGPSRSRGEVRVDISDITGKDDPPVAENDLTLLPEGGVVLADVLANDNDPLGGVLVIQGVSVPDSSGLTVEVVAHARLRIRAPAPPQAPVSFSYTISNGRASAVGTVLVIPVPAGGSSLPPVAVPDEALVRAGDITTVRVLGNDYSPTGLKLNLKPEVQVNGQTRLGEAFASGDVLRFRAGDRAGQSRITYTVRDSAGNLASAEVRVTVVAFDRPNQLPQPKPVQARVVAGNSVSIPIPLDGVDPDGDSVQLVGLARPATLGQVEVKGGYLDYAAPLGARGTDTFEYIVQDRFGGQSTAQVQVGVAPAPATNQNPVAVPDDVAVRPGHEIEVDVTANDLDPDGDQLTLVADSIKPVDDRTTAPTTLEASKVRITAPDKPGVLQYYYSIVDGNGGSARGVITAQVDATVPPIAPIAVDDSLGPADIQGRTEADVDVLANDTDPDGSTGKLSVSVEQPARVQGNQVIVPVSQDRQVILYTITDPDGLSASAAVIVPGAGQMAPTLNPQRIPAKVKAGTTLTIPLSEYVLTRPGHRATLTSATKVTLGPGAGPGDAVTGEDSLAFTPDKMFAGPTFISFEVTDGETIEDPRGFKATLSLPIEVESSGMNPPVFRPSEIAVPPGEAPDAFDLRAMTTDPDPGDQADLRFTAAAAPRGFTVSVDGGNLMVSAAGDTPQGTRGTVSVTVTDGSTAPVTGVVTLTVVSSTRPLATARDADITDARSGVASTLDLTPYLTNPFADRGQPLSLVGRPTIIPEGAGVALSSGLQVSLTPAADFDGQMVVSYLVQDATEDTSRQVTGVIRATVKGKPEPPQNIQATTNASKSATVSWTAGGLHGGTLTGFTVYWSGGSESCGLQTICELNQLENNRDYTFTVTQTTDVAESARSTASNVVRPDVRPNPPSVPVTTFGDQRITLNWTDGGVPDGGSPVDRYTVEVRPAVGGVTQRDVTGTTLDWTGLTNGTPYQFQVVAHNQFDLPSDPSGLSAPEVPAGQPGPPAAPQVNKDPASSAAPRATVSWGPPANANGDSSFTYQLRRSGTATILYTGSGTSTAVTMPVATEDQTFEVQVTNKSEQWSASSPPSNAVRAFQTPGAPTGFSLTPTGANNTATFSFGSAAGNGANASEIQYRWSSGGASGTVTSGQSVTNPAFANGTAVTVQLRAISVVNGEQAQGPDTSGTVNAYGPPTAPAVSAQGNVNDVTLGWNATGTGNGRPIATVELDTSDSGTTTANLNSSTTQGNGRNQTKCIRARAIDSTGLAGAWSSQACAGTWPSPSTTYSNSGVATTNPAGYYRVNLDLRAYNPGSTVRCDVQGEGDGNPDWWGVFRVDGNGNYSGYANGNAGGNGYLYSVPGLIGPGMGTCTQQ